MINYCAMTNEFYKNVKKEYIESIRDHYLHLLAHGKLNVNLFYCTSAKLKLECIDLFENEIINVTDNKIVRNFLNMRSTNLILLKDILGATTTKFRTITYYLKEGRNSSEQTADMAAFLIDFKPRPFHSYYKSKLPHHSKIISSYLDHDDNTVDIPSRTPDSNMEGISEKETVRNTDHKKGQNAIDYNKLKEDLLFLLENSIIEKSPNESYSLSIIRDMLLKSDNNPRNFGHDEVPMMIEYPNGTRIVLKTSDVSFISKLLSLK